MERPQFQYNQSGLRNRKSSNSGFRYASLPCLTMLLAGVMIGYVVLPNIANQDQHKTITNVNEWIAKETHNAAPPDHIPIHSFSNENGSSGGIRRSLQDSMHGNEHDNEHDNAHDNGHGNEHENGAQKRVMEQYHILSSQSLPTATTPYVMHTPKIPDSQKKKILITGGAGFVGSHLVDKLMQEGHEITVLDNFFTGQKKNIEHWMHHPNFRCVRSYLIHSFSSHVNIPQ